MSHEVEVTIYKPTGGVPPKPRLCLKLRESCDGRGVSVVSVDPTTGVEIPASTLVTFKSDGTLRIERFVSSRLPVQLDDNGRIVVANHG